MDHTDLPNLVLIRALEDLDERLAYAGVAPFELNVVGGFALLLQRVRPAIQANQYTDVDYVGPDFDRQVHDIMSEVGVEHHLGRSWVNNDVVMCDLTMEEFQESTGPLHFDTALEMRVITVNVLRKQDLLRMKMIALDSSFMAWVDHGGTFTRGKDVNDVVALMQNMGWNMDEVRELCDGWVLSPEVYDLVERYDKAPHEDPVDILNAIMQSEGPTSDDWDSYDPSWDSAGGYGEELYA